MRNLVFVFGLLLSLSLFSCIDGGKQDNEQVPAEDTIVNADTAIEITGVAIDGAMNSISLLVGDDTVFFSYPDLDNDHRASWDINDSVTIRYYATENGDSVTDVINEVGA